MNKMNNVKIDPALFMPILSQSVAGYSLPLILSAFLRLSRIVTNQNKLRKAICRVLTTRNTTRILGSVNANGVTQMTINGRKVKDNLTAEQLAKLIEYGSVDFKSAGATRKPK